MMVICCCATLGCVGNEQIEHVFLLLDDPASLRPLDGIIL